MSDYSEYPSQHESATVARAESQRGVVAEDYSHHPDRQQQQQREQQYAQQQQDRQAHTGTPNPESVYSGDYDHTTTQPDSEEFYYKQQEDHHEQPRELSGSPSNTFRDTPEPMPPHYRQQQRREEQEQQEQQAQTPTTRGKRFRLYILRMATVPRLRLLWACLAVFGTMSWLALMPAYAFRNIFEPAQFSNPTYTFFLVATVGTSIAAIWQSLCPFLIRQSQRAILPRIINHPITQTSTIIISVILTILNFFSWIILASNSYGAKTNCHEGPLSNKSGYVAQCRGVNTAIVLNVIVFLLWIPIALVIVCGTMERGLWWWGEDDGWAQGNETVISRGPNMMSEEEFDLKIGMRGNHGRGTRGDQDQASQIDIESQYRDDMVQQPKPAFITPIASQFRQPSNAEIGLEGVEDHDIAASPTQYRKHQQQQRQHLRSQQLQQQQLQQQQQQQQHLQPGARRLGRKGSNTSLSSSFSARLSTFFGAGWNSGPMPPRPPSPEISGPPRHSHHRSAGPSRLREEHSKPVSEMSQDAGQGDKASIHGDGYTTQWHSRGNDDWS